MSEGKPTGITHEEISNLAAIEFEGRQAQLYRCNEHGDGSVYLELGTVRGPWLSLYGYYGRGGEFMELDREHLD